MQNIFLWFGQIDNNFVNVLHNEKLNQPKNSQLIHLSLRHVSVT